MITRFDRRPPRRAALATIVMLCVAFVGWTRGAVPAPAQSKDAPGPKDPETLLSIYDVGDLVGTPAFAPPRLGLSLPADDERREEAESRERLVAERRVLELVQLLRGEVESAGHRNARIEPLEGRQIVIDALPDVHEQIGEILADLRGGDVDVVTLEFRVLRLTDALLDELPPDLARTLRFAAFSRAPGGAGRLSEESVETLTRLGVDDESTFAPLLTALSRQRCHLLVVTQAAKIAGVKTVVEGGVATGEPLIGVLSSGVVVEVEPTVSEDRRSVVLALAVDTAHEGGPGEVVAVKDLPEYEGLAGIEEMFVQKPDLVQTRLLTTVRASVGEWTIAGVTTPTDLGRSEDESSVVLVKASAKAPERVPSEAGKTESHDERNRTRRR